mgnify:CR=1 FL=1
MGIKAYPPVKGPNSGRVAGEPSGLVYRMKTRRAYPGVLHPWCRGELRGLAE